MMNSINQLDIARMVDAYRNILKDYSYCDEVALYEFFETGCMDLAYTTSDDENFEIQVVLDIESLRVLQHFYFHHELVREVLFQKFDSFEEMYEFLENMDFDEVITPKINYGTLGLEIAKTMDSAIQIIDRQAASKIIDNYRKDSDLIGQYIYKEGMVYIAIDNSTQDCWSEEFKTFDGAKAYLAGFTPEFVSSAENDLAV